MLDRAGLHNQSIPRAASRQIASKECTWRAGSWRDPAPSTNHTIGLECLRVYTDTCCSL